MNVLAFFCIDASFIQEKLKGSYMMMIELTDEEREVLNEVLQGALTTLEVELHRTDDIRFKEMLKHRSDVMEGILARIPQPA